MSSHTFTAVVIKQILSKQLLCVCHFHVLYVAVFLCSRHGYNDWSMKQLISNTSNWASGYSNTDSFVSLSNTEYIHMVMDAA